jgi:hypothetical protein
VQANIAPVRPKPVQGADRIKHIWGMKNHAARALHQRFDDNRCKFLRMARDERRKLRGAFSIARQIGDDVLRQYTGEALVHAFVGIADRHGRECVAVIGALEGEEFAAARNPLVEPELRRHFERYFDRDRATVGKEHAFEIARQERGKPCREPHRRRMHETAEHHMRHCLELARDSMANMRMIIAVAGRPPARNTIDKLASVGQSDPRAFGCDDGQRRRIGFHLAVRQPDVLAPSLLPVNLARHLQSAPCCQNEAPPLHLKKAK